MANANAKPSRRETMSELLAQRNARASADADNNADNAGDVAITPKLALVESAAEVSTEVPAEAAPEAPKTPTSPAIFEITDDVPIPEADAITRAGGTGNGVKSKVRRLQPGQSFGFRRNGDKSRPGAKRNHSDYYAVHQAFMDFHDATFRPEEHPQHKGVAVIHIVAGDDGVFYDRVWLKTRGPKAKPYPA